MKVTALFYFR